MLRRLLCRLGFHTLVEDTSDTNASWGVWTGHCKHCHYTEVETNRR